MRFEWDEAKRRLNIRQHGVDFVDVTPLFDQRLIEWIDDRRNYGKIRIRCLGEIDGRVYAAVYMARQKSPADQRQKGQSP